MGKRKYPRSVSKYIRREKARIRREVSDELEQDRKIQDLINQFKR
jgi:hypothetical protein